MTNMFSSDPVDVQSVREKYGDDPEKMLQALAHSQSHIAKIEAENADYKAKVSKESSVGSLLEALQRQSNTPPPPVQVDQPKQPSVLDETTLQQKFEELYTRRTIAEKAAERSAEIQRALISKYGDEAKANAAVQAKAVELNLTPEGLGEFAMKSPKAFYQLFEMTEPAPVTSTAPTKSTVNTQALAANPIGGAAAHGTPEYYRELRRKNQQEYFSAKVQNEMMAEAMKNPAKFGIILN